MGRYLQKMFGISLMVLLSGQFFLACNTLRHKEEKAVEVPLWLKPGMLNSQRIEAKFKSFGVDPLAQDISKGTRLSNLHSIHDGVKYSRTLAFTRFQNPMDQSLSQAHDEITKGGSIGTVLSKAGFKIKKDIFFVGMVNNLPSLAGMLMHTKETNFAAIIYDLSVERDGLTMPYCTIAEVYSPEFLTLNEVNQLYAVDTNKDTSNLKVAENLEKATDNERADGIWKSMRLAMDKIAEVK